MQKKIIALAIAGLMSGAAFAQSNVTISGGFDNAVVTQKTEWNGVTSRTQNFMGSGQQLTPTIGFNVTEDLGGGMKAMARLNWEFDNSLPATAPANGEVFVGLSSMMGTLTLGTVNTNSLGVAGLRQPFGTKVGGGYGSTLGAAQTRYADSVKYDSPTWSGFSFGYMHVMGTTTAPASAAVANGNVAAVVASTTLANRNEWALKYANGPINVQYARMDLGEAAAEGTADQRQNSLGVSYDLGMVKLMGGYGTETRQLLGVKTVDAKNWNIAADFPFAGKFNLLANYGKLDSKVQGTAAAPLNNDRVMWGIGMKYAFSKRTNAYVRYVSDDVKNVAAAGFDGQKTTLMGIAHTF
jgi:predicted porin